ncbi:MAG: DUF3276 family protein [Paludibacteraceae bacterium]|nr:DUF3276 family protein [Paludibacteraceae bacterium]
MESRKFESRNEPEIIYSRSVKAGKRIYYLDVKKARNDDLYLCMTESKRRQGTDEEPPQFEKHKLFLYKEDFSHFMEGLNDVIGYVRNQVGEIEDREEWSPRESEDQTDSETEAEEESQDEDKPKRGLFGFIKH